MNSTVKAFDVLNPITNELLYSIDETSEAEMQEIFQKSRSVQGKIGKMSVKQRVTEVMKINDFMIANQEMIITRIVEETGKARLDAMTSEFFEILDVIDYFRKVSHKILADKKVHTPIVLLGKKSKVVFEPKGVILIVAPWNYPLYQTLIPAILAFISGNASVVKGSEHTPLQGLIEEILTGAGFMKDAIQPIYGTGITGVRAIDQRPDKIHFTGSGKTGKKIMAQAAQYLIPVDLELGGKDPSIVFEDVNLEKTVNGVMWGTFTGCGQSCTSIERLYVHESIYDPFVKMIVEKTKKLRASTPDRNYKSAEDCDVGTITTDFQLQIIESHVEDAVKKGAKVLVGGKGIPGTLHYPPTIIVDVDHDMLVASEETFGPVLPIMKFKTEAEAIRLANDSPYGLGSSVWSKDLVRAERVARSIVTGNCSINQHMLNEGNPALPFGGTKQSGFGRYKGDEGLYTFSNIKSIMIDKQNGQIEPHWYPFTPEKYSLLTQGITHLFSKSKNFIKFALLGLLKLDKIGNKQKL